MKSNTYGEAGQPELYPGFIRGYRGFDSVTKDGTKKHFWYVASTEQKRCELTGQECWPVCGKPEHFLGLCSVYANYTYKPGVNVAMCDPHMNTVNGVALCHTEEEHPRPGCHCGFYATHNGYPWDYMNRLVLGSVKATGKIMLGDTGFRAQKLEIEAIACGFDTPPDMVKDALGEWAKFYGVPCFWDPHELLEAFPPQDLSHILPPIEDSYANWQVIDSIETKYGSVSFIKSPDNGDMAIRQSSNQIVGTLMPGRVVGPGDERTILFSMTDGIKRWTVKFKLNATGDIMMHEITEEEWKD